MKKQHTPTGTASASFERPRVVIRFKEGIRLADPVAPENQLQNAGVGSWDRLAGQFPGLELSPVFTHLKENDLQELTRRAMEMDPTYKPADFGTFYYVDAPPDTDLVALVKTFLNWNSVETAYIDQAGPDPLVNAADDTRAVNQGYLDPAPDGIDAEYAWTFTGGDGAGQRFIDLEQGWTLDHEDIAAHGASLLHGILLDTPAPMARLSWARSAPSTIPWAVSGSFRTLPRWMSFPIMGAPVPMRSWAPSQV